jgi:hypothetical protein
MAADYDEASNKSVDSGDMAVWGSRDDRIERTDTMKGQITDVRGQKEMVEGMWKFLVGVKLKEDGWERCHDEVVGRDCWFGRRSDG